MQRRMCVACSTVNCSLVQRCRTLLFALNRLSHVMSINCLSSCEAATAPVYFPHKLHVVSGSLLHLAPDKLVQDKAAQL